MPPSLLRHLAAAYEIGKIAAVRWKPSITYLLTAACAGLVACSEPTAPDCTTDCGTDVRVLSVQITSSTTAIHSADTLRVRVVVENQSAKPTANTTTLLLTSNQFDSEMVYVELGSIAAGARVTREIKLGLAVFARAAQWSDSILAQVYTTDIEGTATVLASQFSAPFVVTGSTFELLGVPTVLRYPSLQTVQLRIVNRSTRAIPADTLHFCLFDYDYCGFAAVRAVLFPRVGSGQTLTQDVPLDVYRDADHAAELWAWDDINVKACYGQLYACQHPAIDLKPDYEAFCQVRRLVVGQDLAATTIGRCGLGLSTDGLDVLSFDAASAGRYDVTADGPGTVGGAQILVMSPEGIQVSDNTNRAHAVAMVTVPGRYYVFVNASGSYNIRVRPY
jgi:hypothetical protein